MGRQRVAGATVEEAIPTGNTTRGKAKFGKRHGSQKREEENPLTRRRLRGTAAKPRKPPPPHTMCHTPSAGRVAFYYFVFLKRRKCIRGLFLGVFGIRGGPLKGSSRIRGGIRGHPRLRCAHVVSHVKVLGQRFPSEDRSCYVGHLCERFFFSKRCQKQT